MNPLTDLWQSFNFANNDDRRRSGFKIQTISLKAVQHFPDWDASVEYTGSPQLVTHTNALGAQYQQNEWSPTFSIHGAVERLLRGEEQHPPGVHRNAHGAEPQVDRPGGVR